MLAEKLHKYKARKDTIVLGIPRGGVVVAYEISRILKLPLDIVITRKIGVPAQKELALGAVDPLGEVVWDKHLLNDLQLTVHDLQNEVQKQLEEIKRREQVYRAGRAPLDVQNKVVILVDDGIATGQTVLSAMRYLKTLGARIVVVAAPVGAIVSIDRIAAQANRVEVLFPQDGFGSVDSFYQNFEAVEDKEVVQLLI